MERSRYTRLIGIIYVIGAIFGLVISLGGLVVLWSTRASVTSQVNSAAALAGRTLDATRETIAVTGEALDHASTDLNTAHEMLVNMGKSLGSSSGLVGSTADLVGNEMTGFVTNTQASLTSVQTSAKVVDNVLRTITGIPLIGPWLGGQRYNPEIPLDESVSRVNRSLDPLPASLTKIRADLDVASENIATTKQEIESLAAQVDSIQANLSEARAVAEKYRGILQEVQQRFDRFQARLSLVMNVIYLGLTLVLIWILITQIGMLIHGLQLMG